MKCVSRLIDFKIDTNIERRKINVNLAVQQRNIQDWEFYQDCIIWFWNLQLQGLFKETTCECNDVNIQ